jgi:predicted nucleic acid-binding protein
VILVDTSVWVDHFRAADFTLARLLDNRQVLSHPDVIGEFALSDFGQRKRVLELLSDLPAASVAMDLEVLQFIDTHSLFGRGIGWVDVHLLAAARLTPGAAIWTRDRRLREAAESLGLTQGAPTA